MPGSKARSMVKPPVRPRVRREPLKERHTPQTSNVVSPATPERCPRPASHDATPARVQANAWKEQDLTRVAPRHMNNIVEHLEARFRRGHIYTAAGPTVIAINPYKADKADDSDANRQLQYAQASSLDTVPVHLYTVSERAVRQLQASHARQAIILSGQSGAGKTYSVSRLVTYIAQRLSGDFTKNGADANVSTIQDQVAATGPIFQAFGNARTVNNPNSSRFGKYLRLHCNDQTQVSSASIEVYLLETSRVVHQQTGEHNFHCFHQLRSAYEQGLAPWGSDVVSKADADAIWSQQTIVPPTHPASEASAAGWAELTAALGCVGFGSTEVHRVAQTLLAIVSLSCIRLATLEAPVDARFVQLAAKLLQIDAHQLSIYIYHHAMIVRGDSFVSPRTVAEARVVISSLQTQLYQLLFSFITDRLNSTLRPAHAAAEEATSIDLLDIFGFERCQTNGFDQLCINLANEQLQEHYLHQLVENQAQILRDEGICELPAQLKQETCMALLAGRGGILDLLDEDSRLKRVAATSNEAAFAERLRGLAGPWLQEDRSRDGTFAVRHYAGRVHYDVLDMPAQNKAKPYQGLVDLLASTRCSLMQAIMQHAPTSKVGQRRVDTVSSAYKKSLRQLFEHLSSVQSHYLRCMSSNDACAAWHFEPETVRTQLEAAGVPQSLEVFAHGRPVMCTLQQLQARLPVLIRPVPCNLQEAAARLQAQLGASDGDVLVGRTRLFFTYEQFETLQRAQQGVLYKAACSLQAAWRMRVAQRLRAARLRALALLQHRWRFVNGQQRQRRAAEAERMAKAQQVAEAERMAKAQLAEAERMHAQAAAKEPIHKPEGAMTSLLSKTEETSASCTRVDSLATQTSLDACPRAATSLAAQPSPAGYYKPQARPELLPFAHVVPHNFF